MKITETLESTPVSTLDLGRYVTVPIGSSVAETVRAMCAEERACACIMDGDHLAGIFTQRDVLMRVIGRSSIWDRPIDEEMSRKLRTMRDTDSVADGFAVMWDWWVRNVPVLDASDALVGNLSIYTVMQTIATLVGTQQTGPTPGPLVRHGFDLVDFTGINTSAPVTVPVDETADVVAHHMRTRAIGSILVVDDRSNLVGLVTEMDLLLKIGCEEADLTSVLIKDIMSPDPLALSSRSSITDALQQMADRRFTHIPLLGGSGSPVGVASFRDVVSYFETSLQAFEDYTPEG